MAFLGWEEVAVSPAHGFRRVADPGVDDSLIDSLGGAVAAEGVAEAVPTRDDFPFGIGQCGVEELVGLAFGERISVGSFGSALR